MLTRLCIGRVVRDPVAHGRWYVAVRFRHFWNLDSGAATFSLRLQAGSCETIATVLPPCRGAGLAHTAIRALSLLTHPSLGIPRPSDGTASLKPPAKKGRISLRSGFDARK